MTIKQQGGIFGRNPTFNDLTVEGTFSQSGTTSLVDVDANKISIQSSTQPALEVDNTGSDGDIIDVQKNGSSVGSIGNYSTRMYLESTGNASGILFGAENLTPRKNATFASDAVSLGDPTYKFKYLYLSRNVVVDNGYGIDFSATAGTGTSELFDDYEEGTWTPVVEGTTTAGTATYARQGGLYQKVGNVVHFVAAIVYNSHTGTGDMRVSGLPYTVFGGSDFHRIYLPFYADNLTITGVPVATAVLGQTYLAL